MAAYAGRFKTPSLGEITIAVEKGQMVFRTAKIDMSMSHWHLDTFLVEHPPWGMKEFAAFQVGPDGKVSRLNLFGLEFSRSEDTESD